MKKAIFLLLFVLSFLDMHIGTTRVQESITTSVTASMYEEKHCFSTWLQNNYCCECQPMFLDIEKNSVQEAGFNTGWLKKIFKSVSKWKLFKSISSWFRKLFGIEEKKSSETIGQLSGKDRFPPILPTTEVLTKTFEDLRSNEEVSTKVSEYLEKVPRSKYNTVKTIRCLKQDADEVRFMMWDGNISKANRIIKSGTETIKLFEYDINSMQEFTQTGENGVEYVYFRIPKYPNYILDGKSSGRVYQSMIFGLPKDLEGNWEKFRAFLIDLFTHPMQLWDEWQFRKELSKFNINSRDVQEIEEYQFAKTEIKNEDTEIFEKEVA